MALIGKLTVVLALLFTVGGDAGLRAGFQATLLRVEITALPEGVAGLVTITGERGATYTITATDERPVAPGTYTVTIRPVWAAGATHYPADDRHQVSVAPGRTTTTVAAYRVAIPDTTTVLDAADPAILLVRGTQIHLAAGSSLAAQIEPGEHLVAAEGPRVPHLLVRRVVSTRRVGDQLVVDTVGATFDQAMPKGVIRFDAVDGLEVVRPAAYTGRDDDPLVEIDFSLRYSGGVCSPAGQRDPPGAASIAGSVKYQLNSIDLDILPSEFDWDIWPPGLGVSFSTGAELIVQHNLEAEIRAAVRCQAEKSRDLGCRRILAHLVRIGPISLRCKFEIVGEAFVEASASWQTGPIEAETTLGFEFGYDSDDGGFHADPYLTNDRTGDEPATPEHRSSFGASLGLRVGLSGGDPAGVAELTVALKFTGGPTITSSSSEFKADLEFTPKIEMTAGVDLPNVPFVDTDWERGVEFTLLKKTVNLFTIPRSTPLTTTTRAGPVTTPAPTTTTPPRNDSFFVGGWGGHNMSATINPDGTGRFFYRDYSGAHTGDTGFFVDADATLRGSGAAMAGEVTRSNSPLLPPGTPVRLERGSRSFEMQVTIGPDEMGMCRSGFPPDAGCGA